MLPGGADWQLLRHDGVTELEARYILRTDDGALIYVSNHALRHGSAEAMAALDGRPTLKLLLPRRDVLRNECGTLCLAHQAHRRLQ